MCGFAGEFIFAGGRADLALAGRMAGLLAHRGPDAEGGFLSADGCCAIGFRRLAVIDPPLSDQPMCTPDGQVTVAFNGEIYNYRELRRKLQAGGAVFRTNGDTEVLLHLYRSRGRDMVHDLDGMFAFIIYDAVRRQVLMARDRLGQKPLWYAVLADRLVFASEAKALLEHPAVDRGMGRKAITYYLSFGYVPAPLSMWEGVAKVPPASTLVVGAGGAEGEGPVRYWQPSCNPLTVTKAQAIEQVRQSVAAAVESHMVSDVPIGALLSGGIDSSIVTALMCRAAGKSGGVRTFTAGFDDRDFDERPAGRLVAAHLGTRHTELLIQPEPMAAVDALAAIFDEPFGDSSALPTWLICRAAREHVKVALAGDGGDEVFGGYDRYRAIHMAACMGPMRYLAVRLAGGAASVLAPHDERNGLRRLARFAEALPYPLSVQYVMYRSLFSSADLGDLLSPDYAAGLNLSAPCQWFCDLYEECDIDSELARAQRHDLLTYLPDDLLVKTDMSSMAVGLELRAPLLDHRLADLGLSLPDDLKVSPRYGKMILREAFAEMLPPEMLWSAKRGFAVPLGRWLREGLRQTVQDVLLDRSFLDRGIFQPKAIHGLLNDHLSGRDDHRHRIWSILMLAKWLERFPA